MNYYIADLHFGHHNIIPMASRPFQCVQDMEKTLIENWNSKVSDKDDVYIIGDFFYQHDHIESILASLKGKKHLISGNHESKWMKKHHESYFVSINTSLEIIDQNHTLFLCHYPMVSYPKQSRSYMVHGHIHNDTLFDYWPVLLKRQRILNAGVDINHFEPVTFNELLKNNEIYKTQIKNMYPMYVLSVRFHLKECTDLNLTKEELYQNINNALKPHNITPYKEGLYHCDESALDYIMQVQHQILNDEKSSKLIKNFDVVHIDLAGNYSYHSYLHQEHIYMK